MGKPLLEIPHRCYIVTSIDLEFLGIHINSVLVPSLIPYYYAKCSRKISVVMISGLHYHNTKQCIHYKRFCTAVINTPFYITFNSVQDCFVLPQNTSHVSKVYFVERFPFFPSYAFEIQMCFLISTMLYVGLVQACTYYPFIDSLHSYKTG